MLGARALGSFALVLFTSATAHAQHEGHAPPSEPATPETSPEPSGASRQRHPILPPHERMGSGTSWLPDGSPMHAIHASAGDFSFMFHGNLSAGYDYQASGVATSSSPSSIG